MMQQPHGQHRFPQPGPQVRPYQQPGYPGGPPRPGGYGPGPQMGPGGPRMMSHGGMPPHPYAGNHRNDKLHCRF
uniref:Uncharacterized protein n=1 Tax=Magallana gigas TaxID=29159 RepID=A0A8W8MEQ6_MAGGI